LIILDVFSLNGLISRERAKKTYWRRRHILVEIGKVSIRRRAWYILVGVWCGRKDAGREDIMGEVVLILDLYPRWMCREGILRRIDFRNRITAYSMCATFAWSPCIVRIRLQILGTDSKAHSKGPRTVIRAPARADLIIGGTQCEVSE
jgi:hypothetical protein